jgi:hypothetical protein
VFGDIIHKQIGVIHLKIYAWQTDIKKDWYIYYDDDNPLGIEWVGRTPDIFCRTTLTNLHTGQTARYRLNPHTGRGELFKDMTFYSFNMVRDPRTEEFENCKLISKGTWAYTNPQLYVNE